MASASDNAGRRTPRSAGAGRPRLLASGVVRGKGRLGAAGRLPTKKAQKAYIRQVYNQIKEEYTPVLKHMTRTQGKVLLKLIDRETEYTAYEVLKEFRGGFVAGFWQGVSRIFGQNLKSEYDKQNEDRMIEQIVIYYEAGLLR